MIMRKKLLSLGILFGLLCIVTESWAWDSGAKFYAKKSKNTPSGSGDVYIYRGGAEDKLNKPNSTAWIAVETGADADITLSEDDKGDGKIDDNHSALNMYFFAKPRTGYDFVGWYSNENETGLMSGSTDHYDQSGKKTRWNNNSDATPPGSGYWAEEGIYYLRYVQSVEKGKDAADLYAYAKFKVKPRDIILGGTGFDEVTYTATGVAGSVGKTTQTLSNASSDIALALTYDSEKYTFEGWLWAEGGFTGGDTISKSASYTYPLATTYVAKGMTSSNKVHIWPVVKRKVVPVAEVTHNAVTTPYESWEEAIAAAKATGVSGATITLYKDIADIASSQEIDRDMTLDLNGHTFAGTANYLFNVTGTGTDFTICNGSVSEGQISFSTSTVQYSYAIGVQSGNKLILQSGKVYANNTKSDGSSRGIEIQSGASLEMTGGSVEAQSLQQAYAIINRGTATISGGDLYAHTTTAATAVAYLNNGTTTEISGGTFRAYAKTTNAYGIQQNVNNTMTITNATVRAEAVTKTAYSLARTNGVIVVNGGKYNAVAPSAVAATNVANKAQITLQGGIYRTNTNIASCAASGYGCYELNRGETWNEGYRYEVLPASEARNFRVVADGTSSYFKEFSDVNTFINAGNFTFIEVYLIVPEYTIPAGNYAIPSIATLVVPYDFDCTIKTTDPGHEYAAPGTPSLYRKLILADGANIVVNGGAISVGGNSQANQPYGGCVYGKYGQIDMKPGSSITLKSGSNLYCWGYITGTGDIIAESGSTVYEDFQIACWRGGTAASNMNNNSKKVFPLAQYYIQNIEAKLHLQAGATEKVWTAVSALSSSQRPDAPLTLVGSSTGLFRISSGTLTKWLNTETDRQMYEIAGNMTLGSISMTVYVTISSTNYILPLTNNMDITIKSGSLSCNNDVALLPGASITIDEGATASLGDNCRLYVYDKEEWPDDGASAFNYPNVSFKKANYTPSTITTPRTYANMADAKMNVNGTLRVAKTIYTTAGGANIYSSEGTGAIILTSNAGTETETYQATQSNTDISYVAIPITSARLRNSDAFKTAYGANFEYLATAGTVANTTITYANGHWGWVEIWKDTDGTTVLDVTNKSTESLLTANAPEQTRTGYLATWTPVRDAANQEIIYTLSWVENKYTVSVAAGANGSVSPASVSEIGCETASGDITATPDAGYSFNGWTLPDGVTAADGYTVASNPIRIHAIAADKTITANFVARTDINYTVKHYQQNIADDDYTEVTADQETKQGTTATATAATAKSYTGFTAQPITQGTIAGDGTTVVKVYYDRIKYAVTWDWNEGTPTTYSDDVKYEAAPVYTYATPTKPSDGTYSYTFTGWSDGTNTYAVGKTLPAVTAAITYTAQYAQVNLDLVVNNAYQLPGTTAVTNVTVTTDGILTIDGTKVLTATNLILQATTSTSGQIIADETNLNVINAYFDLTLNAQTRTWYGVGVPWRVNAQYGIYGGADSEHLTPLRLGKDFDIIWYSGTERASRGPVSRCYQYLENIEEPNNRIVDPGRMYFMFFARPYNVIRFKKIDGEAVVYHQGLAELAADYSINNEMPGVLTQFTDERTDKANWNWHGIANPNLTHRVANANTAQYAYRYMNVNIDENKGWRAQWDLVENFGGSTYVVGQPVMIQIPESNYDAGVWTMPSADHAPLRKMAVNGDIDRAKVQLTSSTGLTDRIVCAVDDEAKDEYTLGSDLVKMTNSEEFPQLWINNYKHALAVNTVRLENSVATYPLTIVSPKAGDYTLSLANKMADGIHVYLTLNGEAIADLTEGEYVLTLGKETSKAYGIRLVRGPRGTVTAIDEALEGKENVEKVVKDGVLYIIRQGNVYDASGRKVE